MSDLDTLLSDYDLARLTGRARSCWQKDRLKGTGPRFVKLGRLIRYRRSDVDTWLEAQVRSSTSDPGPNEA